MGILQRTTIQRRIQGERQIQLQTCIADMTDHDLEHDGITMPLRSSSAGALEHTRLDRRGPLHGQSRLAWHDWGGQGLDVVVPQHVSLE